MGINLQKGQKIDLTKGNSELSELMIGLGWDPVEQKKTGLLGGLFGGGSSNNIDCDASVIMLDEKGKLTKKENLVYFGNLQSKCGSVIHTGDNLTGDGDGDDEQVIVKLKKIPEDVHRLVFVVNIYQCRERKQDFGMIKNAFIRVVNKNNNQEIAKFNLTDDYSGRTALIVGEVYRRNNEWRFAALGESTQDGGLQEMIEKYK